MLEDTTTERPLPDLGFAIWCALYKLDTNEARTDAVEAAVRKLLDRYTLAPKTE